MRTLPIVVTMRSVCMALMLLAVNGSAIAQSTAGTLLRRTSLSVDLLQPTGALEGGNRINELSNYTLVGISTELHHALPTRHAQLITMDFTSSLWGTYHDTIQPPPWSAFRIGLYPRTRDRFVLLGYRRYFKAVDSLAMPSGFWLELQAGMNHRWVIISHDMPNGLWFRNDRYLLPCIGLRVGHDWRLGKHWVLSPNIGIRVNRSLLRDPWHRFVSLELNVGFQF